MVRLTQPTICDLPTEVLSHIGSFFTNKLDMNAALLTSRHLRPFTFSRVCPRFVGVASEEQLQACFKRYPYAKGFRISMQTHIDPQAYAAFINRLFAHYGNDIKLHFTVTYQLEKFVEVYRLLHVQRPDLWTLILEITHLYDFIDDIIEIPSQFLRTTILLSAKNVNKFQYMYERLTDLYMYSFRDKIDDIVDLSRIDSSKTKVTLYIHNFARIINPTCIRVFETQIHPCNNKEEHQRIEDFYRKYPTCFTPQECILHFVSNFSDFCNYYLYKIPEIVKPTGMYSIVFHTINPLILSYLKHAHKKGLIPYHKVGIVCVSIDHCIIARLIQLLVSPLIGVSMAWMPQLSTYTTTSQPPSGYRPFQDSDIPVVKDILGSTNVTALVSRIEHPEMSMLWSMFLK